MGKTPETSSGNRQSFYRSSHLVHHTWRGILHNILLDKVAIGNWTWWLLDKVAIGQSGYWELDKVAIGQIWYQTAAYLPAYINK